MQEFLERYPEVLKRTFETGAHFPCVFPKFRLAGDFVPDFVIVGHRSRWLWNVDFVEIEPAALALERPMFNQSEQTANRLRDAETQVLHWVSWMKDNEQTFFLPKVLEKLKAVDAWDAKPDYYQLSDPPRQGMDVGYHIVIGRRANFDKWADRYRQTQWNQRIEVLPWDRLLDNACSVFNGLTS